MKTLILYFALAVAFNKPNVIILLTDDFGMGDFQINHAAAKVPTPNIDKIGLEGVNFRDAHAGSARCGPSRYMLMTGRYSMTEHKDRSILKDREPTLGKMFKENGYRTGMFGKYQPLQVKLRNTNITLQEQNADQRLKQEYKKKAFGPGGRQPGMENKSFYRPGNYIQQVSPLDFYYDYAFTSNSVCCQPGAYYENGIGIEPVTQYAIQRPYPEGDVDNRTAELLFQKFPTGAYVGPPYFDHAVEGEIYMGNYPKSIITQPSYDSREVEDVVSPKVIEFIDDNANKEEPFFIYYGMRCGHRPFNTPARYRGKSSAGVVGEMIMEADEIVGHLFDSLKRNNIDENTLIIFMSDNGADQSTNFTAALYDHNQNAFDFKGQKDIPLKFGKNLNFEGGHRLPFMWRWPGRLPPRLVEDEVVSYVDVYRTLADIIGAVPKCYEGPDSRSLLPVLTGAGKIEGNQAILTHAVYDGKVALRRSRWKWIPEINALYDMENDISENHNKVEKEWGRILAQRLDTELTTWLARLEKRELRTNYGSLNIC